MVDIDHFKFINDTQGHEGGDAVLSELSSIFTKCMRESDIITRWGGEEFTILMPDTGHYMAVEAAEKLRKYIEQHRFKHGICVTVSIGVAEWKIKRESVENLIVRADEALYIAKYNGRNRVETAP
jgi:diguanylate cyclase